MIYSVTEGTRVAIVGGGGGRRGGEMIDDRAWSKGRKEGRTKGRRVVGMETSKNDKGGIRGGGE